MTTEPLRNRNLGIRRVRVADILDHPQNARRHPGEQVDAFTGAVDQIGWYGYPDVFEHPEFPGQYMLTDGHLRRAWLAERYGQDSEIEVNLTDFTPSDAKMAVLTKDPLAALAETDSAALESLMRDVQIADEALAAMVAGMAEEAGIIPPEETGGGTPDAEPQLDRAEELQRQWQTCTGQLWEIVGKSGMVHRLLIGDCRNPEDMARLCGADKINVAFTSPPYASQRKYDESSGFRPIPPDEYIDWWEPVQANVRKYLADDGSFFVNIKPHCEDGERVLYCFDLVLRMKRGWGWRFVDELCWRKAGDGVPGKWPNRFRNAFEPVYHFAPNEGNIKDHYAVAHKSDGVFSYAANKETKKANTTGSGFETGFKPESGLALPSNVLEIAESADSDHSAAFPIGLPSFFIRAFSDEGDVILDPFMGSGTTCISAENHGRRSLGCEISAKYAAVILQRCLDAGMQPRLLSPV